MKPLRIPMRDGVHLSAVAYSPEEHRQPAPAIFTMTPYVAQSHHEWGVYFSGHGYVFVNVDVRGRGNSEGKFHPRNEAQDGYDIVEWLAQQPWCDGKVAMYGSSYLGYCQWLTASRRPPHLATIVPVAAAFQGVDFPLRGGVFMSYAAQWLLLIAGRTLQDKMFADVAFWRSRFAQWFESGKPFRSLDQEVSGTVSPAFQEWLAHPQRDEYWDGLNPSEESCARLSLPILTITGAYDADQLGALEHYRQHMRNAAPDARSRHYLVIGPWDHAGCAIPKAQFAGIEAGAASLVDLRLLHRQWYAWTMGDAPRPDFIKEPVAYYVLGAEQWRYAQSLEAVTARMEPLYLQSRVNPTEIFSSGSLEPEPSLRSECDSYVYDPRDVSLAALESTIDPNSLVEQRLVNARAGKQLIYHTAPFVADREVSGFFELSLWLSIDRPDTDFRAAVYEVGLDGSVVALTRDWLRARYRESPRRQKLIETVEPLRYDFRKFMFVSRLVKRGHRLRLIVGPINSMYWQKNYNSGGVVADESMADARSVTVKLFHDEVRPSVLYVPYGHPHDEAH